MQIKNGKLKTTVRMTVVMVFILATLLTATLAIGMHYYFGNKLAREATTQLFTQASSDIASALGTFGAGNATTLRLLRDNPELFHAGSKMEILETFAGVLSAEALLYGIYVGRPDGSLLQLINLDSQVQARRVHRAVPTDHWLVVSVEAGGTGPVRRLEYYDADFSLRVAREEPTNYDASKRPWYTGAMNSPQVYRSDVYLFSQLQEPGRTVAQRIGDTGMVIGLDFTLAAISDWLRDQNAGRLGDVYVYRKDGFLAATTAEDQVADARPESERLELSAEEQALVEAQSPLTVSNEMDWPPFDYAVTGQPTGYSIDIMRLVADMTGLEMDFVNGLTWGELSAEFRAGKIDLLQSVLLTEDNARWGTPTQAYFSLPYAIVTPPGRNPVRSPADLAGQELAIPAGWSVIPIIRERFPDVSVVEVGSIVEALKQVQNGEIAAALDSEEILRYVEQHYFISGLQYHTDLSFGDGAVPDQLHMLLDEDSADLRPLIDRAIKAITPEHREQLRARWLDYEQAVGAARSDTVPIEAMINIAGNPDLQGRLVETRYREEPHFLFVAPTEESPDNLIYAVLVPQAKVMAPLMDKVLLSIYITGGFLLLLLPLSWLFASPIVTPVRQLALENDKIRLREYDSVIRVRSRIKEIDELSESMVEMVEAIQAHEQAQRELMDSFIQLIAQAIDDKSAYTGGHCERVPELALMLADSASRSDLPAFRDFDLSDRERWREYRIAAWLHDCGKITTPEHVVDKGSKLETIYNRIHEVRMRFEVLWRDAEIAYLKGLLENPADEPRLRETLECERKRLQDDFRFVADCNVGGEFLDPDAQQRLRDIARITWQRHFDDRLGLSPVDELRLPDTPPPALPATEPLLADKPEHIIQRDRSTDYPPEFGIRMDVPEHLYNLGEVYNLSVSRGTLTAEDRFKINEHMISTIKMLESLPFPEELKNVPRYASTHHETMKGSGYPRKLPGEALSIPERLLAVADVFEALTASDRPYKKAKPVSVAIDILHKMVLDDHIDRDSFELFLREGVYRRYAERFLAPEQIDDVDVARYLNHAA